MIKIRVHSKIMFKDGSYNLEITKNRLKTIFDKSKVALSTSKVMENQGVKHFIEGNIIIQEVPGTEKELFKKVLGELTAAKKNLLYTQKLSWEVIQ